MSTYDAAYGVTTSQIQVATGGLAALVNSPHVLRTTIMSTTGGTCYVGGVTMAGNTLASVGAAINGTQVFTLNGPATVYFTATGATGTISVLRELSQNYANLNLGVTIVTGHV